MAFVALLAFHEPRQASADLIVYSGRIEAFKRAGDPPLFQIVNRSRLRVVFEVPPTPLAAKQDSNGARPDAFSDLNRFSIKSENADVLQQAVWLTGLQVCIKDQSGNIRVQADLENRRQGLLPGMQVPVTPEKNPGIGKGYSLPEPCRFAFYKTPSTSGITRIVPNDQIRVERPTRRG